MRAVAHGRPEGRTLKDAAEASLRRVVGQHSIDDVMVRNREEMEVETRDELQKILGSYVTGISVLKVKFQDVKPPQEVRDAYDGVLKARKDMDSIINRAREYESKVIPETRGEA